MKLLDRLSNAAKALVAPDPSPAAKGAQWWPDSARGWNGYGGADGVLRSTRARLSYEEVDAMFCSAFVACLNTITRALPQAPIEVRRQLADGTWEPVAGHPLPELYLRPNPYHTSTQMWVALLTNYFMSGDGYQETTEDGFGEPRELYSRPYWAMRPEGTAEELINRYALTVNGQVRYLPREKVLHFRNGIDERPPSNGRCGISPIESVFGDLFTDEEAASAAATIMANQGVLTLYTPAQPVAISDIEADAFEARLERKTTGARRGRAVLAQVMMEAKKVGITPEELDFKTVRRIVEERVAAVMCVPAMRAGLGAGLDRSTFTNYAESGAALWEDCLVPLLADFADVLTAFLLPRFGNPRGLKVAFALERVPALQEDRDAKFKRATEGFRGGWLTRNEARAEAGRESEGPTGDVYMLPPGWTVVPWQTPPETLRPAPQQVRELNAMAEGDEGAIDAEEGGGEE